MAIYIDRRSGFWERMKLNHRLKHQCLAKDRRFRVHDVEDERFESRHVIGDVAFVSDFACSQHAAFPAELPRWEHKYRAHLPLCLIVCDLVEHTFTGGLRGLASHLDSNYNYVISTYDCPALHRLREMCRRVRAFYVLPHHIDMTLFRDYGRPKTVDVFLFGSTNSRWYPFRSRLAGLLPSASFAVRVLPHPGYDAFKPEYSGEALAKMINEAWLTLATPSTESYFLYKYLEIAAAGSVVAGELPPAARALWKERHVALAPEMSDTEILEKLVTALADKERLRDYATTMHEIVSRTFTLDLYADRLLEIAADIGGNGRPAHSGVWYRCGETRAILG